MVLKLLINEPIIYNITCHINLVCNYKTMKRKTGKQFDKELIEYFMSKKLYKNPQEARAILRACIEKRLYEKTRKLH